jgi:Transposase DDE domain group 1
MTVAAPNGPLSKAPVAPGTLASTEHALLVPLGHFAGQIGLLAALQRVPFPMKTVDHRPGDKLAELLAHILAGGMHVTELAASAHPLVDDRVGAQAWGRRRGGAGVGAQAWGQAAFASASGVNALLRATTPEAVAALQLELRRVGEPYRRRVLRDLAPSWLVVDFDLTGLVVSDQAATYEGAAYGYMGEVDGPAKGYQFARAQVQGRRDVLLLGGFLHPGRTVSQQCLAELVALTERQLGRPRRRVEAVAPRLTQAEHALAAVEQALAARAAGPAAARRRTRRLETQRARLRAQVAELRSRWDALLADNASNPAPRRIVLRLDGGFGDAAAVTWLYEQGYDFVLRAHNHRVADAMRPEAGLVWDKVSQNGFVAESRRTHLGDCPYPLRLFACRQWRGDDRPERWSALIVNPELTARAWPARRVGGFYNQRQVAEASIKEGKGIFASRHLPTRHAAGIALYQELVLLAQNLVRWFRRQVLGPTPLATAGVKALVRIAANSRALLVDCCLQFAATSRWPNLTVPLRRSIGHQLWFPFLEDPALAPVGP